MKPQGPLYHYTTGGKFIDIMKSGMLWATQAGCLNDEKELLYAAEQLRNAVQLALKQGLYPQSDVALQKIDAALEKPRPELVGYFVSCFTEDGDDLSQWRAYSDGEGGFALAFDPVKLLSAAASHKTFLVRVEYDPNRTGRLLADIVKWTDQFFISGLAQNPEAPIDEWAGQFAQAWLGYLSPFAAFIKHPKFQSEREWRLLHFLQDADRPTMQFVQRRSTITRHIPLSYGKKEGKPHLPLCGVVVGPCRFMSASKIAAGDLLAAHGYDPDNEAPIQITEVPYREV